ncbi:MAG: methyltransferase domain-containing protein [Actinomycetes bacterium]|jgi:16S rRNA (cytosine967-C5)-methyltransferase|nr:methyltransferase domain-containing protein [Actinomycetes bacterium]
MALNPARELAREVVTRVRERNAFAHETMNLALARRKLPSSDAALATRIAYGTIACRGTLDEIVVRQLKRPGSTDPKVLDALACTTWEMLFGGLAAYAAVSQGVDLVRKLRPTQAGLANATLRRIVADLRRFPYGDPATDAAAQARQYGHPKWLAQLFRHEWGVQTTDAIMAANNAAAPLYVAHLPFRQSFSAVMEKLESSGAQPSAGPVEGSILIGKPSAAVAATMLSERDIIVMDGAAQLAVALADVQPKQHIVELGAGRGAKSLLLAGWARRRGGIARVTGVDIHAFKSEVMRADAHKLSADEVTALTLDATRAGLDEALAAADNTPIDTVFIDAPCTGLGTLRRHPDKRWRLKPRDINDCARLGSALLQQASAVLRPGGSLVYSTCTLTAAENAAVVRDFLGTRRGHQFRIDAIVRDALPRECLEFLGEDGTLQTLPRTGGMDGHYVARMVSTV